MEISNNHISPEAEQYQQLINEGNDFMKIEIYRLAQKKFKQAFATGYNQEESNSLILECKKLIAKENRILKFIVAIIILTSVILVMLLK